MGARREPERTCSGCGSKRGKRELIRIVVNPSGCAVVDLKGKLPARGAYLCPRLSCLEKASRGRLASALKTSALLKGSAEELRDAILSSLKRRLISHLGLAQKSGALISGGNLVEAQMRRKVPSGTLMVIAEDSSEEISRKLVQKAEVLKIPTEMFFLKGETGSAIGKSPRSVLLVVNPRFAEVIKNDISRYRAVILEGGNEG